MCLLILSTMLGADRVQLSLSRSLEVSPLPVWKQSVPVTGCQESLHFFWGGLFTGRVHRGVRNSARLKSLGSKPQPTAKVFDKTGVISRS